MQPTEVIEGHLRHCYGRVVYSHKTHEQRADLLQKALSRIRFWQVLLSAITTCGAISVVFGASRIGALVAILVSTALLALNMYSKDIDWGKLSQQHRAVAADLWHIRERYLALMADLRVERRPIKDLLIERDEILIQLHAIYKGAPSTDNVAYMKASKVLQEREDMTFEDPEIDSLLPSELRKPVTNPDSPFEGTAK